MDTKKTTSLTLLTNTFDFLELLSQLVLLGDSGVGKSCIVLRFVRGQFDPTSKVNCSLSEKLFVRYLSNNKLDLQTKELNHLSASVAANCRSNCSITCFLFVTVFFP